MSSGLVVCVSLGLERASGDFATVSRTSVKKVQVDFYLFYINVGWFSFTFEIPDESGTVRFHPK